MSESRFTFTKRHLGWLMIAAGIGALVVIFGLEVIRDDPGGFGTLQKLGALLGAASVTVGFTLLPLGRQPV